MIPLDDHKYANFYLKMCANEWSYRTAWTGDISRSTDHQTREQKIYVLEKKKYIWKIWTDQKISSTSLFKVEPRPHQNTCLNLIINDSFYEPNLL